MLKLRINPLVMKDLKEIRNYIAEDNPPKAVGVIEEIYGKLENVQLFPRIGSDLAKRVDFRINYKYVVWNDYVILYRSDEKFVEIYRVIHRYKDIMRIFE